MGVTVFISMDDSTAMRSCVLERQKHTLRNIIQSKAGQCAEVHAVGAGIDPMACVDAVGDAHRFCRSRSIWRSSIGAAHNIMSKSGRCLWPWQASVCTVHSGRLGPLTK